MPEKLRILIADDHAIFRHGLKDILSKHFSGAAITEAENGVAALELVRKKNWDAVILDVTMPEQNGVDVLRQIKRLKPATPVLMLSMHPEDQYAVRVLAEGAAGYITKIKAPLELVEAVKRSLTGGKYISPALADRMVAQLKPGREKPPIECLSRRQYQILRLIPSGKSLKEIADDLSVTVQTVSTHRARLLKKMGFRSNAELIRYALEHGFDS
jgi:DNA-binding NarL/FixJ family response regulator